jgi:hypothetical protein
MIEMALIVGAWCWVMGVGPLKVIELPDPPVPERVKNPGFPGRFVTEKGRSFAVTMRTLGGGRYYATPQQVLGPMTRQMWKNWSSSARQRKLHSVCIPRGCPIVSLRKER